MSIARERAALAVVAVAGLLVPLNSTMIAVALPDITRRLQLGPDTAGWFVLAYLITMAAVQPAAGKLGDRLGRRKVLLGGMALFGLCSAAAGMIDNAGVIVAARCGQALAGGMTFPNGTALVRQFTATDAIGGRLGLIGSAVGVGAAAGPPLGGVLVTTFGWPSIFLVNLPIVALLLAVAWFVLPQLERDQAAGAFDLAGSMMLGGVLAVGAWVLVGGTISPVAVVLVLVAAGTLAAFVRRELVHPDPVVDLRALRARPIISALFGVALSNLALYGVILGIPFVLSGRRGFSASQIGGVLAAMSVALVLLSPAGGRLSDRFGRRAPASAGLALLAVSLASLFAAGPDAPVAVFVVLLFCSGAGISIASPAMQASTLESMPRERAGMASAAHSTSRYLGSIVGTSILASMLDSGDRAFGRVLMLVTVAAVLSVVASTGLPRVPSREAATSSET